MIKRKIKRIAMIFLQGMLVFNILGQGFSSSAMEEKRKEEELTKENLEQFIDDYFKENLKTFHVPGAAISVVKGDEEWFQKGYGIADIETGKKVIANETTFPACSVSKLFTATAIMQLKEKNMLMLTNDVAKYLQDIIIDNPYNQKITTAQLLTHTAGLDEQSELFVGQLDYEKFKANTYYFKYHKPKVIEKPGSTSRYSNIGYNLLGHEIENITGETYEQYIIENLLQPLQMTTATVRKDNDAMAKGYLFNQSTYEKQPFAYQYASGASGIICTVEDMEHFMTMQLMQGKYQQAKILSSKNIMEMQRRQFANDDIFEGMGYGWIRDKVGNTLILKHEGALPGYATTLILIPQYELGIYVATNSLSGFCFAFEEAFSEKFLKCNGEANLTLVEDEKFEYNNKPEKYNEGKQCVGIYRNYDGIARKSIMKIGILGDATDTVISQNSDGTLQYCGWNQQKEREETLLYPYKENVWYRADGKGFVAFRTDEKTGKVIKLFNNVSHCCNEKIEWFENKVFLVGMITGECLFFLIVSMFTIYKVIRRRTNIGDRKRILYGINLVGFMSTIFGTITMVMQYIESKWIIILKMCFFITIFSAMLLLLLNFQKIIKEKKKMKKGIYVIELMSNVTWIFILFYFHIADFHMI